MNPALEAELDTIRKTRPEVLRYLQVIHDAAQVAHHDRTPLTSKRVGELAGVQYPELTLNRLAGKHLITNTALGDRERNWTLTWQGFTLLRVSVESGTFEPPSDRIWRFSR